eukprot:COSAG01_NODE_903_length_12848_cov_7.966899_8_plen_321_part_00
MAQRTPESANSRHNRQRWGGVPVPPPLPLGVASAPRRGIRLGNVHTPPQIGMCVKPPGHETLLLPFTLPLMFLAQAAAGTAVVGQSASSEPQAIFSSPHGKPVVATLRDNLYLLSGGPSCQGFMRRSTDSGRTFTATDCVYSNQWAEAHDCGGCRDAPVAVGDERTGALFVMLECYVGNLSQVLNNHSYKLNYSRTNLWVAKSTDFGVTFAAPHNITAVPPVPEHTNWTITGTYLADSSGIQTSTGRLVVPGFVEVCFNSPRGTCNQTIASEYHRNGGLGGMTPYNWAEMTFLLVSDNDGASWRMTTPFAIYSGEGEVVQ